MPERVQAAPLPAPSLVTVAPGPVDQHAPGRVDASADQTQVAPVGPQRYALQVTIGETAHENLRYAQALLGHRPAGGGGCRGGRARPGGARPPTREAEVRRERPASRSRIRARG